MKSRSPVFRRILDGVMKVLAWVSSWIGIFFLTWISWEVLLRGGRALNWAFFTELPPPPGMETGGMANAIVGTFMITLLASLIGIPIGIFAGVYMAEFGQSSRFCTVIRFTANILMGTPSIIIGVFVYTLMVIPMGNFSGYAGAAALAIIMIPIISRTTEDILLLVPNPLREAALGLGAPRWKMIVSVVMREAKSGLITAVLLAVSRVSGETAPLLFTALNSPFWTMNLNQPTANLTVTIFNFAMSPYPFWQQLAWGASFLITAAVLLQTIIARIFLHKGTS